LNFSEENHSIFKKLLNSKSKCHETKADAPLLLLESFPKRPRTQSKASYFGGSHKYKIKQTKNLPS
jgi:hypothetical protein